MERLRAIFLVASLLFGTCTYAGTFAKVEDGLYEYTGTIEPGDLDRLKGLVSEIGDGFITVHIDSYGGGFYAGLELGRYTRLNNHKIHLVAKQAYSAAALWAVGDRSFDYYDKDSFLWFHLPYYVGGQSYEGDYMSIGYEFGAYMFEHFNSYKKTSIFMKRLGYLRDAYGINGAIVWRKNAPEKYYDCHFDENEEFKMTEVSVPY